MKRKLFLSFFLLTVFSVGSLFAQNYNEQEKEALRNYLRQPSKVAGKLNLEHTVLTLADTLNWQTSEEWINKFQRETNSNSDIYFYMVEGEPSRLGIFKILKDNLFSDDIDFTPYSLLEEVTYIGNTAQLDFSGNEQLIKIGINNSNIDNLILPKSENGIVMKTMISGSTINGINMEGAKPVDFEFRTTTLNDINFSDKACIEGIFAWSTSFGTDNFVIENCPNLKLINFNKFSDFNENREIRIHNCKALKTLITGQSMKLDLLHISDCTPLTTLSIFNDLSVTFKTFRLNNCHSLENLFLGSHAIENLDINGCEALKKLEYYGNNIQQHILIDCPSLTELNCSNNNLSQLDVSSFPRLTKLYANYNELTELNVTNNPMLETLQVVENKLTSLDVTHLTNLNTFSCNKNRIEVLDFSNCTRIKSIACSENMLHTLILPAANINYFAGIYNYLKDITIPEGFSVNDNFAYWANCILPSRMYEINRFTNKNNLFVTYIYDAGEITSDALIDLSSECTINGRNSTFEWYDENENPVSLEETSCGVFRTGTQYEGQRLTCIIKNTAVNPTHYPSRIAGTQSKPGFRYDISVVAPEVQKIELRNHLTFRKNGNAKINRVESGETFRMLAVTTAESADDVRIGLFEQNNGYFIQDITVSRSSNTYTCLISDEIFSGTYMIQPYTEKDGIRQIIERPRNSHYIDKLPIVFDNIEIWTRSTRSTQASEVPLLSNMMLKTSIKDSYEVTTDSSFQVYVNNEVTDRQVRVGLFNLTTGTLVEDIVTAQRNKTYTCMISEDVWDGDYMIVPYEEMNGQINLVERIEGTPVMDRLPITVVNDIWGWSYSDTRSATDINATTVSDDAVRIDPNGQKIVIGDTDNILKIEIIGLSGTFVRSYEKAGNEISINDLPQGIYILKAATENGQFSRKFIKR